MSTLPMEVRVHAWWPFPVGRVVSGGIDRTFRKCLHCASLKITSYREGKAWREWGVITNHGIVFKKEKQECVWRGENAGRQERGGCVVHAVGAAGKRA